MKVFNKILLITILYLVTACSGPFESQRTLIKEIYLGKDKLKDNVVMISGYVIEESDFQTYLKIKDDSGYIYVDISDISYQLDSMVNKQVTIKGAVVMSDLKQEPYIVFSKFVKKEQ